MKTIIFITFLLISVNVFAQGEVEPVIDEIVLEKLITDYEKVITLTETKEVVSEETITISEINDQIAKLNEEKAGLEKQLADNLAKKAALIAKAEKIKKDYNLEVEIYK